MPGPREEQSCRKRRSCCARRPCLWEAWTTALCRWRVRRPTLRLHRSPPGPPPPPAVRAELLIAAASTLDAARAALREAAAEEVGAAPDWTDFNTDLAISALKQAASLAPLLTDRRVDDPAKRTRSILRREAAGVVVGIASWNAPVMLGVRAIAAPLVCGNTVVMKGSEHCPQTHEIPIDAVNAAGFPAGVVGIVNNLPNQLCMAVTN